MSSPNELPNNPKHVVKDKNPHNYRKVGYSMIIISVSLLIIGLLSWGLADNYHFSTNIMALQEVDTMTPKSGYNIVLFDISQPVGAKLQMLDHGDTLDSAMTLQSQDAQQNNGSSMQVLIFNASKDYNLNLMQDAEVFIQTPKTGYNVILDNYPLAVGAQLTLGSHEDSYANATSYESGQESQIEGQPIKVLIFTPVFTDNLKLVTGSSTPVGPYALLSNRTSTTSNMTQTTANQTVAAPTTTTPVPSNSTTANQTVAAPTNQSTTVQSNQTMAVATNNTKTVNQTVSIPNNTPVAANQTVNVVNNKTVAVTPVSNHTTTALPISNVNATATANAKINETVSLNATGK